MDDTTPSSAPAPAAAAPGAASGGGLLRRIAGWTLRVIAALVVALLLIEGLLRVLGLQLPPKPPNVKTHLLQTMSEKQFPGLGLVLRPGSSGESIYPGAEPGEQRRVVYEVNWQGFRDRPVPQQKPPGTYRIAMLGDSITYGTGLNLEETLPHQLEPALAALLPGQTIEVVNCGVPATNTGQEVALLRYRVLALQPDMVLITSTLEDTSGYGIKQGATGRTHPEIQWIDRLGLTSGAPEEDDGSLTPSQRRLMPWRRHSVLVDLLAHEAYSILYGRLCLESYHDCWAPGAPGVAKMRAALTEAAELSREHHFQLRVSLYPSLTDLSDSYPFKGETAQLAGICGDLGIPFFDLFEPLAGQRAETLRVHAHDRHPNARANALVAAWLAPQLAPGIAADAASTAAAPH